MNRPSKPPHKGGFITSKDFKLKPLKKASLVGRFGGAFFLLVLLIFPLQAQEQRPNFHFYGAFRNDFYFNSRQNEQAIAGIFNMLPRPIVLDENGDDRYAVPEAEILAVLSRFGVYITGQELFGANVSARVEADFAGAGATYFFFRIRHAYTKLTWENSEFLLGQAWHPLFEGIQPAMVSPNTGSPFQPFNRSPQIRYTRWLNDNLKVSATGIYQMQHTSYGPHGFSPNYHKRAIFPELSFNIENQTQHWTTGGGIGTQTIRPSSNASLTSFNANAFLGYENGKFLVRTRAVLGQNMSDKLMTNGYGVSKFDPTLGELEYTNFNVFTSWINVAYGRTWQVGAFAGFLQNLGTSRDLAETSAGIFTVYSRGFYQSEQLLANRIYRASISLSHNLPSFTFGLEYNFTSAQYGTVLQNGRTTNNDWVNNHRIVAIAIYHF